MPLKSNLTDLSQRLADVAARLDERVRDEAKRYSREGKRHFFSTAYENLRDLFTQDVTRDGLRDLVKRDPKDTFRFFARHIDFDSLRTLPWYKRVPVTMWRAFLALAYRLSPPRRIAFAVATVAFVWGCLRFVSVSFQPRSIPLVIFETGAGIWWWLITIAILVLLLLMELRDKLSLKGDLEIAREIQFGLVPSEPFERDNFTIHYAMRPANTVGGDYYDIIELEENHMGLIVGDVAGKGMPAALMMALLQGSLRTLLTAGHRGTELISKLNNYLYSNIPANKLVTLFYAELDTSNGEIRYVNAGHNAPFLLRADRIERLASTSIVIGIVEELDIEERRDVLLPGERLVIFTDGVSEAFNSDDQEYGEDRLENLLKNRAGGDPVELIKRLIDDVVSFCGDARPGDDMTVMLVSHSSEQGEEIGDTVDSRTPDSEREI
jgi:hypothetical protein